MGNRDMEVCNSICLASVSSLKPAFLNSPLQTSQIVRFFVKFYLNHTSSLRHISEVIPFTIRNPPPAPSRRPQRPKTGDALCRECFFWAFETEVHNTITTAGLFKRGQYVAVAASGGKDSTVLAHVMKELNQRSVQNRTRRGGV